MMEAPKPYRLGAILYSDKYRERCDRFIQDRLWKSRWCENAETVAAGRNWLQFVKNELNRDEATFDHEKFWNIVDSKFNY
jgi:hypothetical protein